MKKLYDERTDLEKIQSQWTKLSGLHDRTDWSAAVVRAATAAEIAVNFAIRTEFAARSNFDKEFVDSLLRWGNGLPGKMDRLLKPLLRGRAELRQVSDMTKVAKRISDKRNQIAHAGEFCSKAMSAAIIDDCETFVHGIVRLYEPEFTLSDSRSAVATASAKHEKRRRNAPSRE